MRVKSFELAIIVFAALLFFFIFPLGFVQASSPTAKIVSLDYPRHVLVGKVFPVAVETDYSIKSGADVGIWDAESGVMIQSFAIPLPSAGRTRFDFKLTAPSIEGDWHLVAITRIWWQDAWYQDPSGGLVNFTINVRDSVTVALSSEGAGSTISVDGSQYQVDEGASTFLVLKPGLHILEAPWSIQMEPLKRFVFVGWSDGVNSNPRRIVFSDDGKIGAIYRTEYYMSVKSDRGKATGDGWYEQGSRASFATTSSSSVVSWFGLLTDHYRFSGWSGDSDSADVLASVTMDGPKTVEATWIYSGASMNPVIVSGVFYVGALVLAVRGLYRYSMQRRARTRISLLLAKRWLKLTLLLSALLVVSVLVPHAYAQLPDQPERSIVAIGDASWYYWKQGASDTCLLWLGGGMVQEGGGGYDTYWINPYEYESFGTIRFLQDLTKYYCVIALEKGSYEYVLPDSNRTIFQEPYQVQSQIITQVHDWIRAQGYEHTYLVGYSVGAGVAATQVSMQSPEELTSPDGLILITPFLSNYQIQNAPRIRASLLVLYGGSIETPQYIATGQEFYNKTPAEGWHGSYYLHKEFHIIEKMGHEVWTVLETGAYDSQALRLLVNFVEKSKALQLKPEETAGIISEVGNSSVQDSTITLTSVRAPRRLSSSQILIIEADLSYNTPTKMQVRAIALDTHSAQIESAIDLSVVGGGQRTVKLLVSPAFNSSEVSLETIILHKEGKSWLPSAGPYLTRTIIADTLTVTLETTCPNCSVLFDGAIYAVSRPVQLETMPGIHTVAVQRIVYLSSQTRAVFTEWEDGTSAPVRQVTLDSNATLLALYRKQYFVNASSSYGHVEGSGWYDDNSTATILLQPPLLNKTGVLFSDWTGDSADSSPRTLILVNSPKAVEARWSTIGKLDEWNLSDILLIISPSVVIFAILLILNLRRTRLTDCSADRTGKRGFLSVRNR